MLRILLLISIVFAVFVLLIVADNSYAESSDRLDIGAALVSNELSAPRIFESGLTEREWAKTVCEGGSSAGGFRSAGTAKKTTKLYYTPGRAGPETGGGCGKSTPKGTEEEALPDDFS